MGPHFPPTWTDLAQFLDAFWPEFAATVIGVGLGIPAALAIDRWRQRQRRCEQRRTEAKRLQKTCSILSRAIESNLAYLRDLRTAVAKGHTNAGFRFHTATFEILRDDLALMSDLDLRTSVVVWFETLGCVARLNDSLFHRLLSPPPLRPVGVMGGGIRQSDPSKPALDHLIEVLREFADELLTDGVEIGQSLSKYMEPRRVPVSNLPSDFAG